MTDDQALVERVAKAVWTAAGGRNWRVSEFADAEYIARAALASLSQVDSEVERLRELLKRAIDCATVGRPQVPWLNEAQALLGEDRRSRFVSENCSGVRVEKSGSGEPFLKDRQPKDTP
jgi:hypothetical protein